MDQGDAYHALRPPQDRAGPVWTYHNPHTLRRFNIDFVFFTPLPFLHGKCKKERIRGKKCVSDT